MAMTLITIASCYYYLTAIVLTPGGSSIHLHTNSTQNTEDGTHITITRKHKQLQEKTNNYKEKTMTRKKITITRKK
jgi:hypothetical protein